MCRGGTAYRGGTMCRGGITCRGWVGDQNAEDSSPHKSIFITEILFDSLNKFAGFQFTDAFPHLSFTYVASPCERWDAHPTRFRVEATGESVETNQHRLVVSVERGENPIEEVVRDARVAGYHGLLCRGGTMCRGYGCHFRCTSFRRSSVRRPRAGERREDVVDQRWVFTRQRSRG